MKKSIILISITVFTIVCIVWFLKPSTSSVVASVQNNNHQVQHTNPIQTPPNHQNSQSMLDSNQNNNVANSSNEQLFDTKSDLSIQPIDPEKDPGNQVLSTN